MSFRALIQDPYAFCPKDAKRTTPRQIEIVGKFKDLNKEKKWNKV